MKKTIYRNGNRYASTIKEKAQQLRREGWTHREIRKELGVSLGCLALWTKGIIPTEEQKAAIETRRNRHEWTQEQKERLIERLKIIHEAQRYTNKELIDRIKNFYIENGRIPLKKEFNSLKVFRDHFGSWNNAIIAAGFEPNPILFAKKFTSRDGHPCDSFAEMVMDDWFYERGFQHERNFRYGNTKMTADFFFAPNTVLEFFGLAGVQKKYDEIIQRKRILCKELSLRLIEVYPGDVFPENHLAEIVDLAQKEF